MSIEKELDVSSILKKDENFSVKKKSFLSFFNQYFFNTTKDNKEPKKSIPNKETFEYFNTCLQNNSYALCSDFIHKGYQPTQSQYLQYKNQSIQKLKENRYFISNHYKATDELPDFLAKEWLYQYYTPDFVEPFVYKKLQNFDFAYSIFDELNKNIFNKLKKTLAQLNYCKTTGLINNSNNFAQNSSIIEKFYNQLKFNSDFLTNHINNPVITIDCLQEYKNNLNMGYKYLDSFHDSLKLTKSNVYKVNYNALEFKKYSYYLTDIEQFINVKLKKSHEFMISKIIPNKESNVESIKKQINYLEDNPNFPKEALSILHNIYSKYLKIKQHSNGMALDISLIELETLCENKTFSIVQKYILIDDQYKTTLFDKNGKNAQDLMLDSLQQIETTVDEKLLQFNKSTLKDLSISHQIIKNKQ